MASTSIVSDGLNTLLVENKYDLTSQEELSTHEAKELEDSLNLRPFETCGTSETSESGWTIDESLTLPKREQSDVDSMKAYRSKCVDEIKDEAKMLTRQTATHKCPGSLVQADGGWAC